MAGEITILRSDVHPQNALLAKWLHLLSMLAKKNVCTTSYGSTPGNVVASINLATAKKMVARHPMVPLLAIWLRLLTWLPPTKMVARPPIVALKMDEIQTIN